MKRARSYRIKSIDYYIGIYPKFSMKPLQTSFLNPIRGTNDNSFSFTHIQAETLISRTTSFWQMKRSPIHQLMILEEICFYHKPYQET